MRRPPPRGRSPPARRWRCSGAGCAATRSRSPRWASSSCSSSSRSSRGQIVKLVRRASAQRAELRTRSTRSARPPRPATATSWAPTRSGATSSAARSTARASRSRSAFIATGLIVVIGVTLGMIAGYYRGAVDTALSRSMDVVLAFPVLLLALGLGAACSLKGCLTADAVGRDLFIVAARDAAHPGHRGGHLAGARAPGLQRGITPATGSCAWRPASSSSRRLVFSFVVAVDRDADPARPARRDLRHHARRLALHGPHHPRPGPLAAREGVRRGRPLAGRLRQRASSSATSCRTSWRRSSSTRPC